MEDTKTKSKRGDSGVTKFAAETSPPVTLPRRVIANKVRVSDPGFSKAKDQLVSDLERSYLNTSIRDLRSINPITAIRALTRFNGIFSTAVHSYIQLAMSGYTITAYSVGTHEFDLAGTNAAKGVLVSASTLYDYTVGYGDKQSADGLVETLLKEVLQTGACSAELVLNRYRLPERVVPVPVDKLEWKSTTEGTVYPEQQATAGTISLNIPTFFYASSHQQSNSVFARSPLEAALQMIFVYTEFLEDLTRVLRKSGHSRMVVKVLQESVKSMATPDVLSDPAKMRTFYETVRQDIESVVSSLEPEEALVLYDSAEADVLKTAGEKADYTAILQTLGSMMAASLKSMPSVLGLSQGSQNLATTEALVFLKLVRAIQVPVETVMSRAITLAVRLITGSDCYCQFRFNPINIRPESELSAHKSVIFQNELHKLSLGLYTDDEFAHIVGTGTRPPTAPSISGTLFMDGGATQPKDMGLNTDGQARNLNEGTAQGSPVSQGGGSPA